MLFAAAKLAPPTPLVSDEVEEDGGAEEAAMAGDRRLAADAMGGWERGGEGNEGEGEGGEREGREGEERRGGRESLQ